MMLCHDMLDDCQSESRSACLLGTALVYTIKSLKDALLTFFRNTDSGIFYCYLDDFYSGNSEDIKKNALFKEMYRWIDNSVHLNVNDMFDAALRNTRIDMSPAERRQFYEKHIKHMTLQIDEDGNVGIELKRG